MQKGPFVDAEFEVVADAHPTDEELAERDRKLAAVHAELKRTDLKGWRLWGAIIVALAVTWPVTTAFFWIMETLVGPSGAAFAKFMASFGSP